MCNERWDISAFAAPSASHLAEATGGLGVTASNTHNIHKALTKEVEKGTRSDLH